MNLDLPDLLKVIGPAASIIFAAWIFMGFLQQRYDAAVARYLSIISEYRKGELSGERRGNIRDAVALYKHRCKLMNWACAVGLVSAMLLILTLVAAEIDMVFPGIWALGYVSAGSALLGFALVITAAILVMIENSITQRQLDDELLDIPDLARSIGREAGDVTEGRRQTDPGAGAGASRLPG